ncbi:PIN/TRAM domain-containing protein [Proteiniclasticum sp. BAD-10]|uniref:PIN/TRAM domain-containing protein n=1 Tax=Proteiniclasticum sediminis TaxID=2804028 RepID=A0A941HQT6_9CLOT|nr:PIN/TRAM domain-containing protein [Proteiniclasticum sediminis]MBR0576340.1 PIN/TRAM domain-containing protein [Proteiniclasticum sediminis]
MIKNIIRSIITLVGAVIGYILAQAVLSIPYLKQLEFADTLPFTVGTVIVVILFFALIFFFLSSRIYKLLITTNKLIEKNLSKMTVTEILFGSAGAIVLLVITYFLTTPLSRLWPAVGSLLAVLLNILAAILGANVGIKKKDEIISFFQGIRGKGTHTSKEKAEKPIYQGTPKVLDTSVIIDGRIFDICKTGFVEGKLVIPSFVLEELRHIADSSDSLKRNRGRRGLDILNKIQNELDIEVEIWDKDFPEIAEVDSKLLKLATVLSGKVVTNDYNLNKVAEFQRVPVLNINEMANAVKPMLLPGEELNLLISKVGKEQNQGIGYLDDGTMIVVEDGKRYVGQNLNVLVTSVLQTAAGRMIFAKPKVD